MLGARKNMDDELMEMFSFCDITKDYQGKRVNPP